MGDCSLEALVFPVLFESSGKRALGKFANVRLPAKSLDKVPDFQKVASAYGIASERVLNPADLDGAVERMLNSPGAYLLEVAVREEENVFPMIPAGATLSDIIYEKPEKK